MTGLYITHYLKRNRLRRFGFKYAVLYSLHLDFDPYPIDLHKQIFFFLLVADLLTLVDDHMCKLRNAKFNICHSCHAKIKF